MKKNLLLAVFAFCSFEAISQNIGIGTTNPLNKLHVAGGFRLDTLTGVGGSGLLQHDGNGVVYGIRFTGSTTDVLRGDGSFGSAPAGPAGWLLVGNAGINPVSQFIGTTDAQPLIFKVNNVPAGMIHPTSTNVAFGLNALVSNTTGYSNVANGEGALHTNTTGNNNTAIGYGSLYFNTTGGSNTGIGVYALGANTLGGANTATGYLALTLNTSGGANTANGYAAMGSNTTGN
ncbi:MAG TPA: hypothetical protein VFP87_01045, partial [Chitinophagaceae bacterium]|nr:hypothetical protein [Chitinophagaceae bacterium]